MGRREDRGRYSHSERLAECKGKDEQVAVPGADLPPISAIRKLINIEKASNDRANANARNRGRRPHEVGLKSYSARETPEFQSLGGLNFWPLGSRQESIFMAKQQAGPDNDRPPTPPGLLGAGDLDDLPVPRKRPQPSNSKSEKNTTAERLTTFPSAKVKDDQLSRSQRATERATCSFHRERSELVHRQNAPNRAERSFSRRSSSERKTAPVSPPTRRGDRRENHSILVRTNTNAAPPIEARDIPKRRSRRTPLRVQVLTSQIAEPLVDSEGGSEDSCREYGPRTFPLSVNVLARGHEPEGPSEDGELVDEIDTGAEDWHPRPSPKAKPSTMPSNGDLLLDSDPVDGFNSRDVQNLSTPDLMDLPRPPRRERLGQVLNADFETDHFGAEPVRKPVGSNEEVPRSGEEHPRASRMVRASSRCTLERGGDRPHKRLRVNVVTTESKPEPLPNDSDQSMEEVPSPGAYIRVEVVVRPSRSQENRHSYEGSEPVVLIGEPVDLPRDVKHVAEADVPLGSSIVKEEAEEDRVFGASKGKKQPVADEDGEVVAKTEPLKIEELIPEEDYDSEELLLSERNANKWRNESDASNSELEFVNRTGWATDGVFSQVTEEKSPVGAFDISPTAKSKKERPMEKLRSDKASGSSVLATFLESRQCEIKATERRIVWGKIKGNGRWPLQISKRTQMPGVDKVLSKNQFFVALFGTGEVYWMSHNDKTIVQWKEGVRKGWADPSRRKSAQYLGALEDVRRFLGTDDDERLQFSTARRNSSDVPKEGPTKPASGSSALNKKDVQKKPERRPRESSRMIDEAGSSEDSPKTTDSRVSKEKKPSRGSGVQRKSSNQREKPRLEDYSSPSNTASPGSLDNDETFTLADPAQLNIDFAQLVSQRWITEEAEKERVMWGKVRGHAHWPVQLVHAKNTKVVSKVPRPSPHHCCAMFFGTIEIAWLRKDSEVISWIDGIQRGFQNHGKNQVLFQAALSQVAAFLEPTVKNVPYGWWSRPDYLTERESMSESWIWPQDLEVFREEEFRLPNEMMKERRPKFRMIRRNIYPPKRRIRRLPKDEIPNCECPCTPGKEPRCGEDCMNRMMRLTCDPLTCPSGDSCSNKAFQFLERPNIRPVYIGNGKGWGVVACEHIKKGTFTAEYVGEIIGVEECERRLWECKYRGETDYYMMELSSDTIIDARDKGGVARLINSSCDPNCEALMWQDAATNETRIGIFAIRDIELGEELAYDYGFQDFGVNQSFRCRCDAADCRKWLDAKPERLKRRGERVTVERDGELVRATITAYEPATKSYQVTYKDKVVESIPGPELEPSLKKTAKSKRKKSRK
ncbi:hypothetical protein NDN08_001862 [Rhodosorus marinus]|uniref:Histone-lysine N-methyltransferase n=1 Tax=Rhodosorus marinus TaxID=101924 RepID=A0AAV8US21_9RHOD|nr:hypothetical protein NDN08_001862 [Rhodosorus marinus]